MWPRSRSMALASLCLLLASSSLLAVADSASACFYSFYGVEVTTPAATVIVTDCLGFPSARVDSGGDLHAWGHFSSGRLNAHFVVDPRFSESPAWACAWSSVDPRPVVCV